MKLIPLKRTEAQEFIREHHRHSGVPLGDIFRVGVEHDGQLVGVGVAGRLVARALDDGQTLEVTRVCTLNSFIYGALLRAGRALGYTTAYTYTLASESGASLRAAGWVEDANLPARKSWSTPARPRNTVKRDPGPKVRWRKAL